ncbi:tudor domain-containing protein 1-like isoform X2 [Tachypleus tridentatus]|uniref:tudor domain-containing protein 1-like isoform X2 n=1 Tax=Tachypleus tridentatus TaxID=6853 RepID=UPI003FCF3051
MLRSAQQGDAKEKSVLYVEGVPPGMEKEGLGTLFSLYGHVLKVHVGQSRNPKFITGYGIVHMSSSEEAETAIRELNNKPPLRLYVQFAKSKENKKQHEMKKAEKSQFSGMNLYRNNVNSVTYERSSLLGKLCSTASFEPQDKVQGSASPSLLPVKNLHITSEMGGRRVNCENGIPFPLMNVSSIHTLNQNVGRSISSVYLQKQGIGGRGQWAYPPQRLIPMIGGYYHNNAGRGQVYRARKTEGLGAAYYHSRTKQVPLTDYDHTNLSTADCYKGPEACLENIDPGISKIYKRIASGDDGRFVEPCNSINACVTCGLSGEFRCSRCKTWYCSKNCQIVDWPLHRLDCKNVEGSDDSSSLKSSESCSRRNFQSQVSDTGDKKNPQNTQKKDKDQKMLGKPHHIGDRRTQINGRNRSSLKSNKKEVYNFRTLGASKQQQPLKKGNGKDQVISSLDRSEVNKRPVSKENIKSSSIQQNNKGNKQKDNMSDKENDKAFQRNSKNDICNDEDSLKTCDLSEKEDSSFKTEMKLNTSCNATKHVQNVVSASKEEVMDSKMLASKDGTCLTVTDVEFSSTSGFKSQGHHTNNRAAWNSTSCQKYSENSPSAHKATDEIMATLSLNSSDKVIICNGNGPSEFWVQKCEEQQSLISLIEKLQETCTYDDISDYKNFSPVKGDLCVALFQEDKMWYRACISRVLNKGIYSVYFIDYGNTDYCCKNDLKPLPAALAKLPAQAIKCALPNIVSVDGADTWSDDAVTTFATLVNGNSFNIELIQITPSGTSEIELIDQYGNKVSDLLLMGKIAMRKNSVTGPPKFDSSTVEAYIPEQIEEATEILPSVPYDTVIEKLKLGQVVQLIITVVDIEKKEMWVGIVDEEVLQAVCKVQEELANEYLVSSGDSNYRPVTGEIIGTQSPSDDVWYRAYVLSVKNDMLLVRYIDYGNEETTIKSVPLKPEQKKYPSFAARCTVSNTSNSFRDERLKNLWIPNQALTASVKTLNKAKATFELTDESGNCICFLEGKPWYYDILIDQTSSVTMDETSSSEPPIDHSLKNQSICENLGKHFNPKDSSVTKVSPKVMAASSVAKPTLVVSSKSKWIKRENVKEQTMSGWDHSEIQIVWIDPENSLYVQKFSDVSHLQEMMLKLNQHCNSTSLRSINAPVDVVISAKFKEDQQWYRASITKRKDSSYIVHFLDYGNSDEVPKSDICDLPEEFSNVPVFCIKVKLDDVPDTIMIADVKDVLTSQLWIMKINDSKAEPITVELLDSEGASLNELLHSTEIANDVENSQEINLESKLPEANILEKENTENHQKISLATKDDLTPEQEEPVSTQEEQFYFTDCSFIDLPVGKTVQLAVSSITFNDIMFFQPIEEEVVTKLKEIMQKVNEHCNSVPDTAYVPVACEMCLAKFIDGLWYRAVALQPDENEVLILFADFGNTGMVATSDIRCITPEIMNYPVIAQHCVLQDSADIEWNDEKLQELKTLLPESEVINVTILEKSPDGYYIIDIPRFMKTTETGYFVS